MAGQFGGTPIYILREGSQRTAGRDAQRSNIMAAKAVAGAVRTTLGPKGMDKMLVDTMGDVVITNDGVTILKEMDIEHPAAKMMVEIAKTQDQEVGDGTTSAVVLAGELLKQAEGLLEQEIHPTIIAAGYRAAADKSMEILKGLTVSVLAKDEDLLMKIAFTAMAGKGSQSARDELAVMAVEAVRSVVDEDGTVDTDNITVEKKVGGGITDSLLVSGVVIDKDRLHPSMPKSVTDAKIALLNVAMEIEKTEVDAKIQITSPDQLQAFLDQEEKMLKGMVDKIVASGANVLFVQKGIDDLAQHFLAKAGIYTLRRVKKSDMEKLARATGGKVITSIHEISKDDLGKAGLVEERKVSDDKMTFVQQCDNPKSVSIILRGGTVHVVDELDRAMEDALRVVGVAFEDKMLVAGGGAPEVELALRLRAYASTVSGREQLAIEAFADAMEVIPKTLAENAGLDQIDTLVALRSAHEKGMKGAGLDMDTGKPVEMLKLGVVEPLRVKTQAIKSATEVAVMILRIDDVIASKSGPGAMGGMPGGMGGMGGEDFE
ncbi:MAG: thermosome subunit alpha [Methanothrix sp.]|jgi:thermosome|uniref:Thermosome subunit alpha n=1 Tax=Methanothrix harundinacea TaxID=301375 RepID=A0A101FUV8_9EURY|nr:MAG: Thermosome subunit alpha [Methanothrix harundinacea]MDD2639138.1 thermosome subunit alpha [Methanothrix sp.]MDI9399504.1 thermosome subunit alpha [Euryarchaeota archaeon]KUK96396.1 MAG: Thermosome subunit alpha [Methanothrix harundinacea]MCP1391761.1 TCP-1/cpn60 chaperonin family protein [Methanothrix harundinacea]